MITGHLGSSFYTFLTKCLISHGYRLFKCCQMFRTVLTENTELSDEKISELVDAFMNALPELLKTKLQVA